MMIEILQTIAAGSAVFLAVVYIIGGLIVNVNLARRGVVEFEILKTKYLVAGLVFLLHSIGIFTLAAFLAFPLYLLSPSQVFVQMLNLVSMGAAIGLLYIWARLSSNSKSILVTWNFWVFVSMLGFIFPVFVLIRIVFSPGSDSLWLITAFQALLTGVLAFLAQAYHYSAFYYGRAHGFHGLDPIGVGVPTRVQLACEKSYGDLIKKLGIPMKKGGITDYLYLIDETSHHYIVSASSEASYDTATFKIDKSLVKAIHYHPEYKNRNKISK